MKKHETKLDATTQDKAFSTAHCREGAHEQVNACHCETDHEFATTLLSEGLPDEEILYDLADLFRVFADTTRIKILYALMGGDLCVNDIAEMVGVSQSAVSHQLRTLKQARLVKFVRSGKTITYSLADEHVFTVLAQGMTHVCE